MKKIFLSFLPVILVLSFAGVGICDTVNVKQTTTSGKISYIVSGLIEIKTIQGEKKIWRSTAPNSSRDIVTFGFLNPQRISGEVFFFDEKSLDIKTHNGEVKIPRWKIRDVAISDYLLEVPVSDIKK